MDNPVLWWLVLGIGLVIVELLSGSLFFLFIGGGALLVALLTWLTGMGSVAQGVLFAVTSVVSVLAWRKVRPNPGDSFEQLGAAQGLNNRLATFIGREAVLEQDIRNGRGRVRLDDTLWDVAGTEMLPTGTRVRVVGVDGMTLRVEPL